MNTEIRLTGWKECTIIPHPDTLLTISENGFAKRTNMDEYPSSTRGKKGVPTMNCTKKTGPIVAGLIVTDIHDVMVVTQQGQVIRVPVKSILTSGRKTIGVKLINLTHGDVVRQAVMLPAEPVI